MSQTKAFIAGCASALFSVPAGHMAELSRSCGKHSWVNVQLGARSCGTRSCENIHLGAYLFRASRRDTIELVR